MIATHKVDFTSLMLLLHDCSRTECITLQKGHAFGDIENCRGQREENRSKTQSPGIRTDGKAPPSNCALLLAYSQ